MTSPLKKNLLSFVSAIGNIRTFFYMYAETGEWERFIRSVSLYFFMRHIKMQVEDEYFNALKKLKGKLSWENYFMTLAGVKPKKKRK